MAFPARPVRCGAPIVAFPRSTSRYRHDLHPAAVWSFLREPTTDLTVGDQPASPLEGSGRAGSPDPSPRSRGSCSAA